MQEGVPDPPSVSSINRLLRGSDRRDDDGRKDYSIHGILGGKLSVHFIFISVKFLILSMQFADVLLDPHWWKKRECVKKHDDLIQSDLAWCTMYIHQSFIIFFFSFVCNFVQRISQQQKIVYNHLEAWRSRHLHWDRKTFYCCEIRSLRGTFGPKVGNFTEIWVKFANYFYNFVKKIRIDCVILCQL